MSPSRYRGEAQKGTCRVFFHTTCESVTSPLPPGRIASSTFLPFSNNSRKRSYSWRVIDPGEALRHRAGGQLAGLQLAVAILVQALDDRVEGLDRDACAGVAAGGPA